MLKNRGSSGFTVVFVLLIIFLLTAVVLTGYSLQRNQRSHTAQSSSVSNFAECVAAGNPVMESYPEQCAHDGTTYVNETQQLNNGWNTSVTSGRKAFEITFPDGMGEVIKPLDSDAFYIMGMNQPSLQPGETVNVRETEGFGTDSASLLSIVLLDQEITQPQGIQESFTLANRKENPVIGKKYSYTYENDEIEGIGYQRFAGDRNYTYVFPLKNSHQLVIFYAVYGNDPHNHMATVEEIINTIYIRDDALLQ